MSPWSAYMYNFLTMGVIFPWTFVWAPAAFPGVSVWKACLFAILLELPIALAYVWMATAMPRSGGDYVFQSRVLGGAVGFPVVMSGFVIFILQWVALAGWLLANLAWHRCSWVSACTTRAPASSTPRLGCNPRRAAS